MLAPAHSKKAPSGVIYEPLEDHLKLVAQKAKNLGQKLGIPETTRYMALWHDIGKNCEKFKLRLLGGESFDHASAGAKLSQELIPESHLVLRDLVSYGICGHHWGLPNGRRGEENLEKNLLKSEGSGEDQIPPWRSEIPQEFLSTPELEDFKTKVVPLLGKGSPEEQLWATQLLGRMMFSCLVDADFLATEEFMRGSPTERNNKKRTLEDFYNSLENYITNLENKSKATPLNEGRKRIRKAILEKASSPRGFKVLKVPTGGGKTLISMGYSLLHGVHHSMDRVVYAAPYTTILEENADTLRLALDANDNDLIEHHHNLVEEKDTLTNRLLSENWDSPIVITTHAQLLASLFANSPAKCRKLHNIVNSVIILDEVQKLPVELLKPVLASLKLLVESYNCTIVFCSATQPLLDSEHCGQFAIKAWEDLEPNAQEILFGKNEAPPRTQEKFLGAKSPKELAEIISQKTQCLCIVNSRQTCRDLFQNVQKTIPSAYHLSTWMTPKDRRRVIKEIREKLKKGEPVTVISTSLIEAGVNLDFPCVMRELTGSDSIAQAAGRCNREGNMLHPGEVLLFETKGKKSPEVSQAAEFAKQAGHQERWIDNKTIEEYFKLAFWEHSQTHKFDKPKLTNDDEFVKISKAPTAPALSIDFELIAKAAQPIDSKDVAIAVLDENEWDKIKKTATDKGFLDRSTRRYIRENSFSLIKSQCEDFLDLGVILEDKDTSILRLVDPKRDYSSETGFTPPKGNPTTII